MTVTEAAPLEPLEVGSLAPSFALTDQFGAPAQIQAGDGKHSLVVFFPYAFSGICTGELSEIRDNLGDFQNDVVDVVAVSCDPMFAARAWSDEEGYFFPVLSDFWPHGAVARAFGVFDEAAGHALRGTFLVDPAGQIIWTLVNPSGERRDFDGFRRVMDEIRTTTARSV